MATPIRVALCQKKLGEPVTRPEWNDLIKFGPQFICFPEYFFVRKALGSHAQTTHNQNLQQRRLQVLSRRLDACVIGGTMPELDGTQLYNTSFVYDRGRILGSYRKKNLFFAEVGKITPGETYAVFRSRDITFGVMICADIFHDEAFEFMRDRGARIIFSPTFSLYKEETPEEKFRRDEEIYVSGARKAGAVIVKVCGVPSEYKPFLQARSLIASPEGILYRVSPEEERSELIVCREIPV